MFIGINETVLALSYGIYSYLKIEALAFTVLHGSATIGLLALHEQNTFHKCVLIKVTIN